MSIAGDYLKRHAEGKPLIHVAPPANLKYIVVIPSYNESGLHRGLDSLLHAAPVDAGIEIITVINWPENASPETIAFSRSQYYEYLKRYSLPLRQNISCHFILSEALPLKFAGAGLARKTGMDEAILRFEAAGTDDGIILSFDADTVCDSDYFTAVDSHFKNHEKSTGCSIRFEHPLEGSEFGEDVYLAVAMYELHMRYYIRGLRSTGHPNVFHTVGSAFAVRGDSYCRSGGMNRKKAGEDFYFLQKLFDAGEFSECNTTRVVPSPRPSERAVFGTGPAIRSYLASREEMNTYNPGAFLVIGRFLDHVGELYHTGETGYLQFLSSQDRIMQEFLLKNRFRDIIAEINANTSTPESFRKRLHRWFNMFRMLKFLNFSETDFPRLGITEASGTLLERDGIEFQGKDITGLLNIYREEEKRT